MTTFQVGDRVSFAGHEGVVILADQDESYVLEHGPREYSRWLAADQLRLVAAFLPGESVVEDIEREVAWQLDKWGEQNHPDGTGSQGSRVLADEAREHCEQAFKDGLGTWRHILMEEVAEAFAESNEEHLAVELTQVAAVVVSWRRAIIRRQAQRAQLTGEIADAFEVPVEIVTSNAVDMVNNPPHYTSHPSGVEAIDITEHMGFNTGNVVKYLWRDGLKDGVAPLVDLRKAKWYLDREISRRERFAA